MSFFEETLQTGFERTEEGRTRLGFEFKQIQNPDEKAAYELYKILNNYPEFTEAARREAQEEFLDFEDLSVLNLETMAAVLAFLKLNPNPSPESFKDENILVYFERLVPTEKKLTKQEKNRINLRLKAEFLKYITAINEFRRE